MAVDKSMLQFLANCSSFRSPGWDRLLRGGSWSAPAFRPPPKMCRPAAGPKVSRHPREATQG